MATVSGQVVFDRDRSATISAGDTGIANVAIVLQNIATGIGPNTAVAKFPGVGTPPVVP